ncbi:MAG: hypothetical protein J7484_15430, partial [Microbacterium sp.]|nr:hypothetical protein [Microbacterium sp.]
MKTSTWLRVAAATFASAVLAVSIAGCSSTPGGSPAPEGTSTTGGEVTPSRPISVAWSAAVPAALPGLLAADNSVDAFTSRGLTFQGSQVSAPDALPLLSTGKLDVFFGPISAGVFNAIGAPFTFKGIRTPFG